MKRRMTLSGIVRTIDKIVFALALITILFVYSFWRLIKDNYGVQIFYIGTALAFIGFILSYHIRIKKEKYKIVTTIALLLAINNLADELFFNPGITGINEYLTALIITLTTLYKYRKWEK